MTTTLYVVALITLGVSFFKSKEKTILALKKAWKAFENILPQFQCGKVKSRIMEDFNSVFRHSNFCEIFISLMILSVLS